jgi:hypothetical protein
MARSRVALADGTRPSKVRASDLKTVLIGKMAEFVRWPAAAGLDDPDRAFEFAILGSTPLMGGLVGYYSDSSARIAGHRVYLRRTTDLSDVGKPHLLFVGSDMEDSIPALLSRLGNAPVLTMADTDGFAQRGIALNFYQVDDQVRFEISRRALQRAGLQASYRLLSRATLIDDQQARR